MSTFWTGNLWVVDKTGTLIFKLVVNRWVERRPGLQTGASTLKKLLRKHLPAYRAVSTARPKYGEYIRTLGQLNEGTDIIFVYDPDFKDEMPDGTIYLWHRFYDGLVWNQEAKDNVPNTGYALATMKQELGLDLIPNPDAPTYTIGATPR